MKLRRSRWAESGDRGHNQGWTGVLVWMEAVVEDGATMETRAAYLARLATRTPDQAHAASSPRVILAV